jgi:hypothetical protein
MNKIPARSGDFEISNLVLSSAIEACGLTPSALGYPNVAAPRLDVFIRPGAFSRLHASGRLRALRIFFAALAVISFFAETGVRAKGREDCCGETEENKIPARTPGF